MLTSFDRAAVVLAVLGVAFAGLVLWLAAPLRGMGFEILVPVLLGPTLKSTLCLAAAAVMAWAGRLERRRVQRRAVEVAATLSAANDDEVVQRPARAA